MTTLVEAGAKAHPPIRPFAEGGGVSALIVIGICVVVVALIAMAPISRK